MSDPGRPGLPDDGSLAALTASDVEDLLAGRPGPPGTEALAGVLTALAAPPLTLARAHGQGGDAPAFDTRGYEQARRAFEAAGARRGGTRYVSGLLAPDRGLLARFGLLTAVLAVAGVGTAAAADALPAPIQQFAHTVLGPIGVPAPAGPGTRGTPGISALPTEAGPTAAPSWAAPSSSPSQSPSSAPENVALCQAYQGNGDSQGITADQRARLTVLAGGKQRVAKYCQGVLAGSGTTGTSGGNGNANGNGGNSGNGNAGNSGGNGNSGSGNGNGNAGNSGGNGNAGNGATSNGGKIGSGGKQNSGAKTGQAKPVGHRGAPGGHVIRPGVIPSRRAHAMRWR